MAQFTILAKTFFHSACVLDATSLVRLEEFLNQLRMTPDDPGLGFQVIEGASDPGMRMSRLSKMHGVISHHEEGRIILLLAAETKKAQAWARRHRVTRHPKTGTVQLCSIPSANVAPARSRNKTPRFPDLSRYDVAFLVALGIPEDWAAIVKGIHDEASFWNVFEQMPEDAAEYLYALYLGEEITPRKLVTDLERNLDNLRWMYLVQNDLTVEQVLDRPFEEWMLFLHPTQRELADGDFNGPLKVTGSAGTGKTVLAVHRSRHFARLGHQVLLVTYTNRLADNLQYRVGQLCYKDEVSRITVSTVHKLVRKFARERINGEIEFAFFNERVRSLLEESRGEWGLADSPFSLEFVIAEWEHVVDRHGIRTLEEYLAFDRTGRRKGLDRSQRESVWQIFKDVLDCLEGENSYPPGLLCRMVREEVESGRLKSDYRAVVVDEIQDLGPEEIRLLRALCDPHLECFTLIGDTGQRIYRGNFSFLGLGIETRGRSHRLKVNYRTTMEIEKAASFLRSSTIDDLEGTAEADSRPRMVRRGPLPILASFPHAETLETEPQFLVREVCRLVEEDGVSPAEIAVFARYWKELAPFSDALRKAGYKVYTRDDDEGSREIETDRIYVSSLHSAKGLEFRYVFVVRCENGLLPSSYALNAEDNSKDQDLVRDRERSLLYVAMTRARDQVWVSWSGENPSPFLDRIPNGAFSMSR